MRDQSCIFVYSMARCYASIFFRYLTRKNLLPDRKKIYTCVGNNETCELIESSYFIDFDPE